MADTPVPDKKPSRAVVFARRATSTIALWVLIGGAIAWDSPVLLSAMVVVVGVLAALEFLVLLDLKAVRGWAGVSTVTGAVCIAYLAGAAVLCHHSGQPDFGYLDAGAVAALLLLVTAALLFHPIDGVRTKDMLFGALFCFGYTAVLISFLIRLLYVGGAEPGAPSGVFYVLFLLVVTKFSDMGAYIVGTAIGKNKFIPHISPGKTWEGILLGCFPFAIGGAFAVYALFADKMPLLSWGHVAILGFGLAAIAVVGDLAESVLKRCLAKKDSGNFLPGIGGVLDLVDSILFTAPALFFYLTMLDRL